MIHLKFNCGRLPLIYRHVMNAMPSLSQTNVSELGNLLNPIREPHWAVYLQKLCSECKR